MTTEVRMLVALLACTSIVLGTGAAGAAEPVGAVHGFEENRGQEDCGYAFVLRSHLQLIGLAEGELAVTSPSGDASVFRIGMDGGTASSGLVGEGPLQGVTSYFRGSLRSSWVSGVPSFARVRQRDVHPGIDVVHYLSRHRLEFDFVVGAAADPTRIGLRVTDGRELLVTAAGELAVRDEVGATHIVLDRPFAYQDQGGVRVPVMCEYALDGALVRLGLGAYDPALPLVIDPIVAYASYLGGRSGEEAAEVAVDADGAIYVALATASARLPVLGAPQPSLAGDMDLYVAKFDASGHELVYATYIGGSEDDIPLGMAVDRNGAVYIVGRTDSVDFPIVGGVQGALAHPPDGFVTKLSADGTRIEYSTYLGGTSEDTLLDVAVDGAGRAYVAGHTRSSDYPLRNPLFSARNTDDAVFSKLAPDGASLEFSTLLGGESSSAAHGVAVDEDELAYITGHALVGFPALNAAQSTPAGRGDAFVQKLNTRTPALVYSTLLGGSLTDRGEKIAVDDTGRAIVAGKTFSPDFPQVAGLGLPYAGGGDVFLVRVAPNGSAWEYASLLGGSSIEESGDVAVDSDGNAYLVASSLSSDYPVVGDLGPASNGSYDTVVTAIDASGRRILYSGYFGGSDQEKTSISFPSLALDSCRRVVIADVTRSSDLPVTANAYQPLPGTAPFSGIGGFYARIANAEMICPADAVLECTGSAAPAAGSPATSEFCGPPVCASTDVETPTCGGARDVARTWDCAGGGDELACTQRIEVVDRLAPDLVGLPSDQQVECSTVPPPPLVTAFDRCDPAPALGLEERRIDGRCPNEYVLERKWTATDACGNRQEVVRRVEVRDTVGPELVRIGFDGSCLWPPNHRYHCIEDVAAEVEARDACDGPPPRIRVAGCRSSEPDDGRGDGDTDADCLVSKVGKTVCVRAERSGTWPEGRTYSIDLEAEDSCGNVTRRTATIRVPHDVSGWRGCARSGSRSR